MAKKQKKFHKIIIHPNRYLIWTLAITFIVAASLVAYAKISNIDIDADTASTMQINFWHTYTDASLSFRYPAEWLIDPGTGYIGFGPKNQDDFLVYEYATINDPAYQSYAKLTTSKPITVGGMTGIRIPTNVNGERIAFVKTTKHLFEFRGTTPYFDQILSTVHFMK